MIQNLLSKGASRNIKCQYILESNTHAINVTQNLLSKGASRNIKCQYMLESNNQAINVTKKLSHQDHLKGHTYKVST